MHFLNSLISTVLIGICFVDVAVVAGSHLGRRSGRHRRDTQTSVEVSGLDILKTYVCPTSTDATAVKRQIQVVSGTTTISIPISDLEALFQELSALIAQLAQILEDEGLSIGSALAATVPATVVNSVGQTSVVTDVPIATVATSIINSAVSQVTVPAAAPVSTAASVPTSSAADGVVVPVVTPSVAAQATSVAVESTAAADEDDVCSDETTTVQSTQTVVRRGVANVVARGTAPANVAATSTAKAVATGTSNGYVFDSQSSTNIAVYLGQSPASLEAQCSNSNADIVVIQVTVSGSTDGTKYPTISFGPECDGQTTAMKSLAPGLVSCPSLASMIHQCQSAYGKKVLLSIESATRPAKRETSIQSNLMEPNNASDFVNTVWELFGPPGVVDAGLRPFGDISVDGFVVDENATLEASFDILATTLRSNMASATDKQYYLSSIASCGSPMLAPFMICDFVFVSFANETICRVGGSGFKASIMQWSSALEGSTLTTKPRLYIGAPSSMEASAKEAEGLSLSNLGGVMVI